MSQNPGTLPALYQAEPSLIQTLGEAKNKVRELVSLHAGKAVRVQTLEGHMYEGVIHHAEGCILYLHVGHAEARAFLSPFNPFYSSAILPLVLYELLVITLLYT
jgi:hypothetical protein